MDAAGTGADESRSSRRLMWGSIMMNDDEDKGGGVMISDY